jgi:hypothetical protein
MKTVGVRPRKGRASRKMWRTREPMSETHFDRSDWRPGKRRRTQPRVKCYGGQKVAARRFVGLDTDRAARCTATARSTGRKCRRVALKNTGLCLCHNGALIARNLRPYVATAHGQRIMAERALGDFSSDKRKKAAPQSKG